YTACVCTDGVTASSCAISAALADASFDVVTRYPAPIAASDTAPAHASATGQRHSTRVMGRELTSLASTAGVATDDVDELTRLRTFSSSPLNSISAVSSCTGRSRSSCWLMLHP